MCAIFGAAGDRTPQIDFRKVAESLSHRGPDGEGFFTSAGGEIHLGMRRLAVIDPEAGEQPVYAAHRQVAVVCNGEIYNWKALRDELERAHYQFSSRCDTEILAAGWCVWGRELFQKLNGMFAIAIYDGRSEQDRLILVRDPCGQKPLYLYEAAGQLLFASEIKGLRAAGVPLTLDQRQIREYLALRYVSGDRTLFSGVSQLGSGELLEWSGGQSRRTQWWSAPAFAREEHETSPVHNVLELGQRVDQAVAEALQSDFPLALYLSAGVDSALLLEAAGRLGGEFTTLTAGFGAKSDEVCIARQFASRRNIVHHEVILGEADFANLPRVISQMDVPVGDALILAFDRLASATKDLGCKVALGGEGPDELFLGYSFQKMTRLAQRLGSLGRAVLTGAISLCPRSLLDEFSQFPAALGRSGRAKLTEWLGQYTYLDDWSKVVGLRTVFTPDEIERLMLLPIPKGGEDFKILPAGACLEERSYRHQFSEWLPDWSIIRQDRNTMAHGVEYRMPFLDPRLIAFSGRVPVSQKLAAGSTKWLWRELAKQRLGSEAAQRPKQPFYFPLESLSESKLLRQLVGDYLSPPRIKAGGLFCPRAAQALQQTAQEGEFLPMKQLFSLLVFEIWREGVRS